MKTIIIFGATGMIGAYAAVELAKKYKIIAVGLRKNDKGFFNNYGIEYHSVDIMKKIDFDKLPKEGIYAVVHVAGAMPARMEGYDPHMFIDSKIHGMLNILEYMVKAKINRIIYGVNSNSPEYKLGKTPVPANVQRTFPKNNDHSVYSICTNAAADIAEHFYYKYGIKRFLLSFGNIYHYHPNPYYYSNGKKRWVSNRLLMEYASRSMNIEIWGDPSREKEVVYIYDLIAAMQGAVESSFEGGLYNIGGVAPISLEKQIQDIIEVFSPKNKPSNIIYASDKPSGLEYAEDITKTQNELGYMPQWDHLRFLHDIKKKMETSHFSQLWGTFKDYEDESLAIK